MKESVAELTAVSEALEQAGLRAAEENRQLTEREREREIERFALLSELSHWQTLAAQVTLYLSLSLSLSLSDSGSTVGGAQGGREATAGAADSGGRRAVCE